MRRFILLAVVAVAVTACGRSDPPPEPATENSVIAENVSEPANVAAAPPLVLNSSEPVERPAPPPAFDDQKQMADDADASGMTARLPDQPGEGPGQSGNQTRPAE